MNEAQKTAFSQIEDIMREHFDGGAFCVMAKLDDGKEAVNAGWHGGKALSVGLFTFGADRARGISREGEYSRED